MLKELFGSETAVKTLMYIEAYESGYAKAISDTFGIAWSQIQKQLDKFEAGGVLIAEAVGRTRVYRFNSRYYFAPELRALIRKAVRNLNPEDRRRYFEQSRRPRRKGGRFDGRRGMGERRGRSRIVS